MVDQLERMMEVMLSTPGMQDMLLAKLPPHMRRPEVLRAMLANPEVRTRMADLMQHSGLSSQLLGLDPRRMAEGMAASRAAGLDPAALLAAFHASPSLAPRMSNPRVLTALMDLARWVAGSCCCTRTHRHACMHAHTQTDTHAASNVRPWCIRVVCVCAAMVPMP
jgi:hypothetical protein